MAYKDTEKRLNELRSRDEIMFRMAISHLMDVGIRNLTPELIEECCAEINQQDDSHSFMTNRYQCELVRLAGELAKIDHIELLVYISQNVEYAVYDGAIPYRRMKEIARNALDCLEAHDNELWDGFDYVLEYQIGMTDEEMAAFGYGHDTDEDGDPDDVD